MKSHQAPKKTKANSPIHRHKLIIWLSTASAVVLVSVIGVIAYFTYWNFKAVNDLSNIRLGNLIVTATDQLSHPMPIDTQTARYVMPYERLVLPADKTRQAPLYYDYEVNYDFNAAPTSGIVHIVDQHGYRTARTNILSSTTANEIFSHVPQLQACSRGYVLSINKEASDQGKFVFSKKLTDGRTVNIYHDTGCLYSDEGLEQYLRQIDSY